MPGKSRVHAQRGQVQVWFLRCGQFPFGEDPEESGDPATPEQESPVRPVAQ